MISIFPCYDILKAFTDKNIDSSASRIRVNAFEEADLLVNPKNKDVEIIIEGNLFDRISKRLEPDHIKIFREIYEIDESASNNPKYDHTQTIKFIITEKKLKISPKSKIIVITDNLGEYEEFIKNSRVRVIKPEHFLKSITKFKEIRENYDTPYGALVTVFFVDRL